MSNAVTIIVNRTPITVAVSGAKGAGVSDVSDLTTTGWSAGDMPRALAGGAGFEKRTPAQVLGDIGAAMASESKTASFTAVVGGRYHVTGSGAADGSVQITNPSSPAARDIYQFVVISGYVRVGGIDYAASCHEITRRFTGATWTSVSPRYSQAPTYESGIVSGARINLGAGTTGDALFTAATVAAANAALKKLSRYLTVATNIATGNYYTELDIPITPGVWAIRTCFISSVNDVAIWFEFEGPTIDGILTPIGKSGNVGLWNVQSAQLKATVSTHSGGISRLAQVGASQAMAFGTLLWPTSISGTLRVRNTSGVSSEFRKGSYIIAEQL